MKDKIFGVLQRVGRSFMLPIALLPVAGLLLGVGSSFTNATMLEAYGLTSVIYPGSILYTILDIMNQCGNAVFANLALLFAMGVAIGMAKKEKEVAALSGAIGYLVMNTAISAMINANGGVEAMAANSTTTALGITTLQMGVFGGSGMVALTPAQGIAIFVACLPIALGGWLSAIFQGRVAAASINIVAKRPEEATKGIILCGIVEFYAILSLLATILLLMNAL